MQKLIILLVIGAVLFFGYKAFTGKQAEEIKEITMKYGTTLTRSPSKVRNITARGADTGSSDMYSYSGTVVSIGDDAIVIEIDGENTGYKAGSYGLFDDLDEGDVVNFQLSSKRIIAIEVE